VPILLLLAGVVILAGVVSVAMGHGGEMAEFAMDYLPPDVLTATDVAMLRPPSAFWGYNVQVTDEALNRAAQAITEREAEIAVLRQQLAGLRAAAGSHPAAAATHLAGPKAAAAATDSPGLDAPRRGGPGPLTPDPGLDAGTTDTGTTGTGSADAASQEAAASRDD
jgi:hypothetical protein